MKRPILFLILTGAALLLHGCADAQNPYPQIQAEYQALGLSHDPTVNGGFILPPSSADPGQPNGYYPRYGDRDDY